MALSGYLQAAFPKKTRVLGVLLRDFSLGHYLHMRNEGCAFASDDPEQMAGIEDLLLGVCICACTYEEFEAYRNDPTELFSWCDEWRESILRMAKEEADFNFLEKLFLFKRYITDGTRIPAFWGGDEGDGKGGLHWSESVLHVLTSELNYPETEVLNMPLTKAFHLYCQYLHKNGAIELMSEEDLQETAECPQ
jgi:hypothetical protein